MTGASACQRPDCEGSYEDVGGGELYCDVCGLAPVVSPTGSLSSSPTGVAGNLPGGARRPRGGAGREAGGGP
ncbi:hypothetical protein, partial [Streptomyces fuscigenes]|uniref:hypothetical protein n=1 Tax=Streptomyces fuscigenes TaxID=1528880 RepID=UPI001F49118A